MSQATDLIQRRFHLPTAPFRAQNPPIPFPDPGQILLLTGMSGAGKSTALRSLILRTSPASRIILNHIRLPNLPVVDLIPYPVVEDRLNLLSRVGLAEVYLWLAPPSRLSEGQRFRLRLAIALARSHKNPTPSTSTSTPTTLFCDEFASTLDTLTALMISQTLRKSIPPHSHLRCILATGRDELIPALKPDLQHHCNFQYLANTT